MALGTPLLLLLLYVGGALSISFLCSVLEATLLSTRSSELKARATGGDRGAAVLLELKSERVEDAISAILTLNTIAHTIGAALAGAQAAVVFGDRWVGAFSGVLTLLVLVCTEIIPKTLGTVYASQLAGVVGRTLRLLTAALKPILWVTRMLTRLVARHEPERMSRAELAALVDTASADGAIAGVESRVFGNLLQLNSVRVEDVMTPRTVLFALPAEAPARTLIDEARAHSFSRIPIFEGTADHIVGYVFQREVLRALATEGAEGRSLQDFKREAWFLRDDLALGDALRAFLERGEHMALVVDQFESVRGLVTLEDLVETLVGVEIVDEVDAVADMRALALKIRDRRIESRA